MRMRAYGIYTYRVSDPKVFYQKLSGTAEVYRVSDLEGQLRDTIVGRMTSMFAGSSVSFLDMAANQLQLGQQMLEGLQPVFGDLGLRLDSFVVENISLPDELQKILDQRIGMNMIGDMGRYTQYQVAQSIPIAAANEGNPAAGVGVGLGAGLGMAQAMMGAMNAGLQANQSTPAGSAAAPTAAGTGAASKFCTNCGHSIPRAAKFCSDCGAQQ